jgi:hypothetical protein
MSDTLRDILNGPVIGTGTMAELGVASITAPKITEITRDQSDRARRDMFAAAALQGLLASGHIIHHRDLAARAWAAAAAMMEQQP